MSDSNREMWGHLSPKEKEDRRKDETIEALQRRIRELEEKNYQLKATRGALIDAFTCVEYAFAAIGTENAELKRQVEALREDAEKIEDSRIPVKHLPTILTLAEKMVAWKQAEQDLFRPGSCEQECHRRQYAHELAIEIQDLTAVLEGRKALREAAKGEVE